ncbi:MAG: Pr6Pr family membrane protein [Rhodoglobus sp.]|nr:Pr6Pr family membrane protein [Rhodoglobus sp.]
MRIGFAILRVAAAVAGVAAIVGQLITSLDYWPKNGVTNIALSVTNFFSFFTIQSNVAAIVVFLIGAALLVTRKGEDPAWFNLLRACVVTYMVVTGIVYNLLLRNVELPQGTTLEWSNEILHVGIPVLMLLDWLFTPGRAATPWNKLWIFVVYPIAWVVFTMVRGPFTPSEVFGLPYWYPYPFLDPNLSANGYLSVSFYVVLIALVIVAVGAGIVWISRRKQVTS